MDRGQLLRAVMGPGYADATGNLRVYIVGLRKKLEADPSQPRLNVLVACGPVKEFPPRDPHAWRARCEKLHVMLRQYLGA